MADLHPLSRQHYLAWLEERIEEHKAHLSRAELLELADQAVRDLFDSKDGQYPLTEILLRDAVNALIVKQLRLPGYRKWLHLCQNDTGMRPPGATGAEGKGSASDG